MNTVKNLSELIINVVDSDDVYEKMQANGIINDNELYLVKEDGAGGNAAITMKTWTTADMVE